jgi:hypothetical protein
MAARKRHGSELKRLRCLANWRHDIYKYFHARGLVTQPRFIPFVLHYEFTCLGASCIFDKSTSMYLLLFLKYVASLYRILLLSTTQTHVAVRLGWTERTFPMPDKLGRTLLHKTVLHTKIVRIMGTSTSVPETRDIHEGTQRSTG